MCSDQSIAVVLFDPMLSPCFRLGHVGILPVRVGRLSWDSEPGVLATAATATAAGHPGRRGRGAPAQETLRHQHVHQPLDPQFDALTPLSRTRPPQSSVCPTTF